MTPPQYCHTFALAPFSAPVLWLRLNGGYNWALAVPGVSLAAQISSLVKSEGITHLSVSLAGGPEPICGPRHTSLLLNSSSHPIHCYTLHPFLYILFCWCFFSSRLLCLFYLGPEGLKIFLIATAMSSLHFLQEVIYKLEPSIPCRPPNPAGPHSPLRLLARPEQFRWVRSALPHPSYTPAPRHTLLRLCHTSLTPHPRHEPLHPNHRILMQRSLYWFP